MLPFCGYNMSDYFAHWLALGEKIEASGAKLPAIYTVNWFRTDAEGKFVWPGFGENMRVLKWMLDRIDPDGQARADGVEHVFGVTPRYEDLSWDGSDFSRGDYEHITSIDKAAWKTEILLHTELFSRLEHHLPAALLEVKDRLSKRLAA